MNKLLLSIVLLFISYVSIAQNVKGTIINQNNEKLQGANIICLNSNSFTFSDKNGGFSIALSDSLSIIKISYIGYKSIEKEIVSDVNKTIDLGDIMMQKTRFMSEEVSVVASREQKQNMSIPADISVVDLKQMSFISSDKIDQNLKFSSGIYIDRPFGIFGKSLVGMRSIVSNAPGRQLTLIDGIPINKSDGGGTNWNRIIEADFQKIEVLKGPSAAIYGNNAMGGIINLIHKRPINKGMSGEAGISYSSYNSMQADVNLMQKLKDGANSFYYTIAAKALKSDGYNTVPDSIREEIDTSVFLQEYGVNSRVGYLFSDYSRLEIEYNYYDENRGQGTKIKLENGAVARYKTHFSNVSYSKMYGKIKMDLRAFYQVENYNRDIEKLKKENYTHIIVNSQRKDIGASAMFRYQIKKHNLSFGADYKSGSVYGIDEYQTSTDKVINEGVLDVYNLYLTDEWQIATKFKTIVSLHYALGKFHDGAFTLKDYTKATDYMLANIGSLDNKNWKGFNPRIALQYDFRKTSNIYAIYSHGYRAPTLDDITRYGFVNIGYKNANPELLPEQIDNIELGYRLQKSKWELQTNAYFSQGEDFMYYVATGETMFGGRKKVYQKENISLVDMYGAEFNINYYVFDGLKINANYTLNGSEIKSFSKNAKLEGKKLSYVPVDISNFSINYNRKSFYLSVNVHYQGEMFLDEENTFSVDPLIGLDINIRYILFKKLSIELGVQNVFDEQHLVNSKQISLGRYIKFGIRYSL